MANKELDDEVRQGGGKKRLARAKVKRAEGQASNDRKAAKQEHGSARAKERKEKVRNAIIAVFAVIMALSMALPSLSTIVTNNRQNTVAEEDAEAGDTEETEEESTQKTDMERVDDNYKATIDPLEEKLKEDDKDLATILNLGNDYMSWAYDASTYSNDEESQEHVNDLFKKAIEYFDQYLELNDSVAVEMYRTMCVYYSSTGEESDAGIDAMVELAEQNPDYAPVWRNLALLYEQSFNLEKAKETYQKAAEIDADDEYGVKSFANSRLASLNKSQVQTPSQTINSTTPTTVENDAGQSLTSALTSASDTSF